MNRIEVEDTLRLINYIKSQQAKGFSNDEIKEKLLNAGWNQRMVEKYMSKYVLSDLSKQEDITIESFAKYGKLLLEGEEIKSYFEVGFNHIVLITSARLIFIRKFPKHLKEFKFNEIEIVEYFTNVQWLRLFYSIFYLVFFIVFLQFNDFFWRKLVELAPSTVTVLNVKLFLGLNIPAFVILIYLFAMFVYDGYTFGTSFLGKLRIMPKHLAPVDIITKMTSDVERIIEILEQKIEQN